MTAIYVPASAGQEAIRLLIYNKETCPTADDIQLSRHPIVAWEIDPAVREPYETKAVPVLPYTGYEHPQYTFMLITMTEGRVYSVGMTEAFETLDAALADCLRLARAAWHREQATGSPGVAAAA